ncbi:repressed by TUP1 protein 5 [Chaetomidium leptoderma]|uniref:Repressed by TUP1 protein 5 n=1 Tax=Chaetomidium leptoderma TaxID=669021 RepID=A0AAN6VFB3_9PEZI|nr:repressed by TUP1 protein 5 [Chaetomidium leptoderma]
MPSFRYTCAILGLCLLALCNASAVGSISLEEGIAALPDCARSCLGNAMMQSACPPADFACLCEDAKYSSAATVCVKASCTIKESLTTKNITERLCGRPIETGNSLIPIHCVFIGLAIVAVVLRLLARVLTLAYFWWDDFANLFAFIGAAFITTTNIISIDLGQATDMWFVPHDQITRILQIFFFQMLGYTITRFFVRASIILFYMRVFPPPQDNKLGRILQWTMVCNAVYNVSFLFAVIFQCTPTADFWRRWEGGHEGHCGDDNILAWVAAVTGLVFDLWLLALPFPQLLALNLHWKKKLMGGMMFCVGLAVMIISLVRLKTINEFTRGVNPTKDIAQVCLWSGIELDVGVICPCLPSFRLLLRRLMPRVVGTSGRHGTDPVSNTTGMMRSGVRRSIGGGEMSGGQILVENTVDIKFGTGDSIDGRSAASVAGLAKEGRVSSEASVGDAESGRGYSRGKGSQ